jgi:hypothetical protein
MKVLKMYYSSVWETQQELFRRYLPLSQAQRQRVGEVNLAMLLANSIHLSQIARWMGGSSQQASRIQHLRRLWDAPYLCQEQVYYPWVKQALAGYHAPIWHVVMDRTSLDQQTTDLLSVSLSFRGRAIPLVWHCIPHGGVDSRAQIALLQGLFAFIPAQIKVLFHGDTEFGSLEMIRFLRQTGWDFILGQRANKLFRETPLGSWRSLSSLPVTPHHSCYLSQIEWTRQFAYRGVNLFAFAIPKHPSGWTARYFVTSLPIAHTLRQVGRRRWGTECFYRDYKSAGWKLDRSMISQPKRREALLTCLSLNYLWCVCLGRWLCKTGQRSSIDANRQRHLSLFRLGWDWLVHSFREEAHCPLFLTLYQ